MSDKKNKLVFYLSTLLILLAIFEGSSALFFHKFKDKFSFVNMEKYIIPDKFITYFAKQGKDPCCPKIDKLFFDAELGFDIKSDSKLGERKRKVDYEEDLISTFGDSYTYGSEVEFDQTWETYLSSMLNKNVYNFGVPGHGTDQAYLKFKKVFPKIKTKYVVLSLISENLHRTTNTYRPFYFLPNADWFTEWFAKPVFLLDDDKNLKLVPNPVKSIEEIPKLKDKEFLKLLGQRDEHWTKQNPNNNPEFAFPYSTILFNKNFYRQLAYRYYGEDKLPDFVKNYFKIENFHYTKQYKLNLLFAIFDAFYKEAKEQGAVPIIALFPWDVELVNTEQKYSNKDGSITKIPHGGTMHDISYAIDKYMKEKKYNFFNAHHVFQKEMNSGASAWSLITHHYTPKGNKVVAKGFFEYIKLLEAKERQNNKSAVTVTKATKTPTHKKTGAAK